ncbi:MAG: DEAD/DEAH box helicase [Cocleimonas sp.]
MSFSDFNLQKEFIKSIEAAGYLEPTPLQSQLIPLVNERKSALIWTQSASGKTGAFLIPAMNYILENPAPEKRGARVLILTSRRDRVSQINYTIKRLSKDIIMRFGFIVSGRPYQTQMRLMRRPLDIMIATPGRLNDLMNNGKADFSQLEMLIIDDLTSIYKKNLQELVEKILEQAGSNCSSITFAKDGDSVSDYARSIFPNAVQLNLDKDSEDNEFIAKQEQSSNNTQSNKNSNTGDNNKSIKINPDELMPQKVHIADDYTHKIAMMDHLMDEFAGGSTVIYTATTKSAKTLQDNLSNHGHAAELAHEVNPDELFENNILIFSDQKKVSLTEEQVSKIDSHIINFDLPHKIEDYLDRLNTHNQKRSEATLLIIDGYNYNELKTIEKALGEKLDQATIPGLEPLKPFVNLSKSRAPNKQNSRTNKTQKNGKWNKNKKTQKATGQKNSRNKPAARQGSNQSSPQNAKQDKGSNQRRQRKGPFGRLNGGTHRKNSVGQNKKVGVSSVGTNAPKSDRGWQSDFAEPKERSTSTGKPVAIRYSKKRLINKTDKPEESE